MKKTVQEYDASGAIVEREIDVPDDDVPHKSIIVHGFAALDGEFVVTFEDSAHERYFAVMTEPLMDVVMDAFVKYHEKGVAL